MEMAPNINGLPLYTDEKSASFVKFLMENMTIGTEYIDKACAIISQIEKEYPNLKRGEIKEMENKDNLFGNPFVNALYVQAPLSWAGYEIQRMYEGMGERKNWIEAGLADVARTLRLPREDMKVAAIWFWLQRCHKETSVPGKWAEADRQTDSPHRFWTLFYFAYLDFMRFDFNPYFRKQEWCGELKDESLRCEIASDVIKQLIGYRGANPYTSRIGDLDGYKAIAEHAQQSEWENRMSESVQSILALSFQANGWAQFRAGMNADDSTQLAETPSKVLFKVVQSGLSSGFHYAADEFERRALFFMLAQRLYVSKDLKTKYSRERALFAALYLDLYRRPLGELFIRKSFRKKWEAIPFETKEDFAVKCRRVLVEIRNEAAKTCPVEE